MGARDSDDDIRKYLPDIKTIMREADPAHGEQKLKAALDNPELDRALAELQKSPSAQAPAAATAPSPWVKDGADAIDRAALPSANAPKAAPSPAPPVTAPSRQAENRPAEKKRRPPVIVRPAVPGWAKSVFAVLAVLGPLAALWLAMRSPPPAPQMAPDAATKGQAAPSTTASSSIEEGPAPGAARPGSSSLSIEEGPGAAPGTGPAVSAAAASPGTAAPGQGRPGAKQRGSADDPYTDAAPGPPRTPPSATAAPAEPTPAAPPAPRKNPVEDNPVF